MAKTQYPSEVNGINILRHYGFEKGKHRYVDVACPDCFNVRKLRLDRLKNGGARCQECGHKSGANNRTTHGLTKHPLFNVWASMIDRCYWSQENPNELHKYELWKTDHDRYIRPKWSFYIGVTVCDEWKADFKVFYDWALANGYESGLELDKDILCDDLGIFPKTYSPSTCKWITGKENKEYSNGKR